MRTRTGSEPEVMRTKSGGDGAARGLVSSRTGLTYPLLRPVPVYSLNPFYWLGALSVIAFIIQGITGVIMMLYYIPSPTSAYATTKYIFQSVYFGQFLQTIHLYTAYAMIFLTFMHMMRGYFVSVHKRPREVMWVVGCSWVSSRLALGSRGTCSPGRLSPRRARTWGSG